MSAGWSSRLSRDVEVLSELRKGLPTAASAEGNPAAAADPVKKPSGVSTAARTAFQSRTTRL